MLQEIIQVLSTRKMGGGTGRSGSGGVGDHQQQEAEEEVEIALRTMPRWDADFHHRGFVQLLEGLLKEYMHQPAEDEEKMKNQHHRRGEKKEDAKPEDPKALSSSSHSPPPVVVETEPSSKLASAADDRLGQCLLERLSRDPRFLEMFADLNEETAPTTRSSQNTRANSAAEERIIRTPSPPSPRQVVNLRSEEKSGLHARTQGTQRRGGNDEDLKEEVGDAPPAEVPTERFQPQPLQEATANVSSSSVAAAEVMFFGDDSDGSNSWDGGGDDDGVLADDDPLFAGNSSSSVEDAYEGDHSSYHEGGEGSGSNDAAQKKKASSGQQLNADAARAQLFITRKGKGDPSAPSSSSSSTTRLKDVREALKVVALGRSWDYDPLGADVLPEDDEADTTTGLAGHSLGATAESSATLEDEVDRDWKLLCLDILMHHIPAWDVMGSEYWRSIFEQLSRWARLGSSSAHHRDHHHQQQQQQHPGDGKGATKRPSGFSKNNNTEEAAEEGEDGVERAIQEDALLICAKLFDSAASQQVGEVFVLFCRNGLLRPLVLVEKEKEISPSVESWGMHHVLPHHHQHHLCPHHHLTTPTSPTLTAAETERTRRVETRVAASWRMLLALSDHWLAFAPRVKTLVLDAAFSLLVLYQPLLHGLDPYATWLEGLAANLHIAAEMRSFLQSPFEDGDHQQGYKKGRGTSVKCPLLLDTVLHAAAHHHHHGSTAATTVPEGSAARITAGTRYERSTPTTPVVDITSNATQPAITTRGTQLAGILQRSGSDTTSSLCCLLLLAKHQYNTLGPQGRRGGGGGVENVVKKGTPIASAKVPSANTAAVVVPSDSTSTTPLVAVVECFLRAGKRHVRQFARGGNTNVISSLNYQTLTLLVEAVVSIVEGGGGGAPHTAIPQGSAATSISGEVAESLIRRLLHLASSTSDVMRNNQVAASDAVPADNNDDEGGQVEGATGFRALCPDAIDFARNLLLATMKLLATFSSLLFPSPHLPSVVSQDDTTSLPGHVDEDTTVERERGRQGSAGRCCPLEAEVRRKVLSLQHQIVCGVREGTETANIKKDDDAPIESLMIRAISQISNSH